jgi:hypothetical protein
VILMRRAAYAILYGSLALTILLVIIWVLGYVFDVSSIINQFYFWVMASMLACLGIFVGIVLLMFSSVRK